VPLSVSRVGLAAPRGPGVAEPASAAAAARPPASSSRPRRPPGAASASSGAAFSAWRTGTGARRASSASARRGIERAHDLPGSGAAARTRSRSASPAAACTARSSRSWPVPHWRRTATSPRARSPRARASRPSEWAARSSDIGISLHSAPPGSRRTLERSATPVGRLRPTRRSPAAGPGWRPTASSASGRPLGRPIADQHGQAPRRASTQSLTSSSVGERRARRSSSISRCSRAGSDSGSNARAQGLDVARAQVPRASMRNTTPTTFRRARRSALHQGRGSRSGRGTRGLGSASARRTALPAAASAGRTGDPAT
jgi:hypothetical protein